MKHLQLKYIEEDNSLILEGSSPILEDFPQRLKSLIELTRIRRTMPHDTINEILIGLCSHRPMSIEDLVTYLNREVGTIRQYTAQLVRHNRLAMKFPDKQTHPQQEYYVPSRIQTQEE
ncbi:MAG: hypothetical protein U0264_07235 [Candidatus Kapaibacterium sp.]